VAPIAATNPGWASLVTSRTPERPRAVSDRRNVNQPAPTPAVIAHSWKPIRAGGMRIGERQLD
jgi:hypothetical protein